MQDEYTRRRADIFWSRVDRADGCWPWMRARYARGYGAFRFRNAKVYAHRFAWEITFGPIPDGMFVCHRCDNPPCCRPDHLFLGTPGDNTRDRDAKGRSGLTRPGVRPVGERHPHAKLTEDAVRAIRARYATGSISPTQLAREYGVGDSIIHKIVRRQNWKHVA